VQDVDDINRLLAVSQPPDGGMQLRRRKQILLEGLAASLQLSESAGRHSALLDRSPCTESALL
jgi:DNA topoisomerase 2-associated protein PAT1